MTDYSRVLSTIRWWGRIDDLSCRLLTDALRAVDPRRPVRIHAFAAGARDLFRCTLRTLSACHSGRSRGACFGRSARHGLTESCIAESARRREELLAAIVALRSHTLVQGAESTGCVKEALSAVLGMCDSIADFLEQVLQPLARRIGRNALRAFVLETRAEIDELAARLNHQLYTESLTVTQASARSMSVELAACIGSTKRSESSL